jgi:hypothetical protein
MIARSYAELCDAFAARLIELNVQHLEVDHTCGLATGYTGKLLGPKPTKHYGPRSLDLHLQALGLMLIVVPDTERQPLVSDSREFRPKDSTTVVVQRRRKREARELLAEILRENQKKGARKISAGIRAKVSPARRSRNARKNIMIRWKKELKLGRKTQRRLIRTKSVRLPSRQGHGSVSEC